MRSLYAACVLVGSTLQVAVGPTARRERSDPSSGCRPCKGVALPSVQGRRHVSTEGPPVTEAAAPEHLASAELHVGGLRDRGAMTGEPADSRGVTRSGQRRSLPMQDGQLLYRRSNLLNLMRWGSTAASPRRRFLSCS